MTTAVATKPLPPHGTYARAVGRPSAGIPGCRCPKCKAKRTEYKRRADYLAATGRALTVDSGPACEHLRDLMAQGAGWLQLRAVTGCSLATISDYLHGKPQRIHRSTADRILAVRLEQVLPEPPTMPALGTMRRAQALMAIGHSPTAIAEAADCHVTTVTDLVYGRGGDVIRPRTVRRIAVAYERLSARPGTHALSQRRAKANGWAPPLAWDDIDNPNAVPDLGVHVPRPTAVKEDVEFLEAQGVDRDRIAERLGLGSWNSVEKTLARAVPATAAGP